MKQNFSINELQLKNDSVEELNRTREIFDVLKEKAIKGEPLSEHEKEFFCLLLKLSLLNDGNWDTYSCCDNYKFQFLYFLAFGFNKTV